MSGVRWHEGDVSDQPEHIQEVQGLTLALGQVFLLTPGRLRLSVMVSFLISNITGLTEDPVGAWETLKEIIDNELPEAMTLLRRKQN